MSNTNRIDPIPQSSLRMSTTVTEPRQTPDNSFGARIHYGLNQAAGVIVNTASVAGSFLGAPIVSAAVSQVSQLGGAPGTTVSPLGGGGGGGGIGGQYSNVASAAFGTAQNVGSPGLVQAAVASSSGPIAPAGLGGLGGVSSNLVSTYPSSTSGASVTTGGVSTDPFSAISGASGSAGGYQNYFSSLGQQQYQMLNLQIAMQQEYQFFATLSNVLKTRHDTVKAAISNIR